MKGGAAGGGYAQVVPMEDINLHFTGDMHAISAAHNLLAAMIDNHLYWDNSLGVDSRRISWRRVVDINDRALRDITVGLGGISNGFARSAGFDITVASEIMAILCLSTSREDLKRRLGNIVIAETRKREPITAQQLEADGAMAVLLKDALMPNLVQTLENNPAFVHGGPFANIAHGCNTIIATETALHLSDYTVTEAGFGADLGAEKFFNIKCRKSGLTPDAVVIVATVRALKSHGGVARTQLTTENVDAVRNGLQNLGCHIENIKQFGVQPIVAINRFSSDKKTEISAIIDFVNEMDVTAVECNHWADGSAGAEILARKVVEVAENKKGVFSPLYPDKMGLFEKINTISTKIYGASEATAPNNIREQLKRWEDNGFGNLPVCMAKTQYSFSTNPELKGAPKQHSVPVRQVRLAAGAEFVVAVCGDIMTMPGLPRVPAANSIRLDDQGKVEGLF
tara:strand:- start:1781 stop:3142 length:1362 start_codon:yes stop_codon:yes gene_type:complete